MSTIYYYFGFGLALLAFLLDFANLSRIARSIFYVVFLSFLAFGVSIAVAAFDVETYRRIFLNRTVFPDTWALDQFPEYGYQLANYLWNGVFGFEFESFRFIWALISLFTLYGSIRYVYKQHVGVFFFLYYPKYYLVGLISHVRSAFVAPFVFLAMQWALERRYIAILLASLALSQVHMSALLLNIMPVLRFIPLTRLLVLLTVPAAFLVNAYFAVPLLNSFTELIDLRQSRYFEASPVASQPTIEYIRRTVLVLVCFYVVVRRRPSPIDSMTIKVFLLSVFIYIGFNDARFISDRIAGMFGVVEPWVLIAAIRSDKTPTTAALHIVIVLLYGLLDFALRAGYLAVLPQHITF